MKKLNNKGFTLVEVLAVVIILSVLVAIMVPSVNHLIEKNKQDDYEKLKEGFIQATKVLFSDYRYEVSVEGTCNNSEDELNITKVGEYNLMEMMGKSKVPIQVLVDETNISVNEEGKIIDPSNKEINFNLHTSYVLVKYKCSTKDFHYEIKDEYLDIYE